MPLRDPFATEDDEPSTSALGRPPRRIPGAGHPAPDRGANTNSAPRSLGLSLGVPRSRMVVKRDNEVDTAVESSVARQADDAVRNTDSDALLSRLSALKLGYLPSEPFTQEFSSNQQSSGPQGAGPSSLSRPSQPGGSARRSPLINIGTYLRCTTIDREVESFLKQGIDPKQIISIGAGSDTRYWRIMSNADLSGQLHHYVEIDFAENTSHKLSRILRSKALQSLLDSDSTVHGLPLNDLIAGGSVEQRTKADAKRLDVLRSSKYTLLAADLRQLHPDTPPSDRIDPEHLFGCQSTSLKSTLPTLILFECVLSYIPPDRGDWLIKMLGERFADVQTVSYDMALAGDSDSPSGEQATGIGNDRSDSATSTASQDFAPPSRFGRVMLQNLEMRNLALPGAKAYPTIRAQCQRFERAWSSPVQGSLAASYPAQEAGSPLHQIETHGRSLFSIWSALAADEKQRLSRLEGLDEVEEIDMLLKHYCIVQARRKL